MRGEGTADIFEHDHARWSTFCGQGPHQLPERPERPRPVTLGGVDILAAGRKLGLGEDRICVQVKSGDGAADQDVVLKLMGSVQTSKARTGLLVSLGGVNSAAQRMLDSEFFVLRLWQMPELLGALFRTYSQLSEETRLKLPLKQIWAPAPLIEG